MKIKPLGLIIAFLLMNFAVAEENSATLKHNPFSSKQSVSGQSSENSALSPNGLELRAVIFSGEDSIVNVNGKILAIGDHFDGYKLVAVREGEADFVSKKVKFTLNTHHHIPTVKDDADSLSSETSAQVPAGIDELIRSLQQQ